MEDEEQAVAKISEQTYTNQRLENGEKWYLNEVNADVHFTFGEIESASNRIPANKIILATDSSVFEAMFYGDLKELGDVHVPDSTEAAFMEFLQYFYMSNVKLTVENVAGVLHLGEKYDVKKCVDDCVHFLKITLDDENVCAYLDLAILYAKKQLIELCKKCLLLNTKAIFNSVGFLKCTKNVFSYILKMDVLSCGEDDVFKACMSWVKDKIGRVELTMELVERHLGELYSDIRFASMTMEQLCELQKKYKLVLTRDFIDITNMIVSPDSGALKRQAKWNANAIMKCDRQAEPSTNKFDSRSHSDGTGQQYNNFDVDGDYVLSFAVNEPVILGSLSCNEIFAYSDCDEPYHSNCVMVEMNIYEFSDLDGSEEILLTMNVTLESDGTDISLTHPILIRPGFSYDVRFGPFPSQHQYYSKFLKWEVELDADIKIQFLYRSDTSLISELHFNKI